MKKLLIISYAFPPSNDPAIHRICRLAKHLPHFGWQPLLLTAREGAYFRKDIENQWFEKFFLKIYKTTDQRDQCFKMLLMSEKSKSTLRFLIKNFALPDPYFSWIRPAVETGNNLIKEHKPDAILATVNPYSSGLIGSRLSQNMGIPFIIDYRDPWTLSRFHRENIMKHFFNIRLEKIMLNKADRIFVTSEPMKKLFTNHHYFPADKIHVVTNGTDEEMQYLADSPEASGLDLSKFNITYTGGFYNDRQPYDLLRGFAQFLKGNPDYRKTVRINFIGSEIDQQTRNIIVEHELQSSVSIFGEVSFKRSIKLLKESDILLIINGKGEYNHIFIPAKFFDYLAVEKPIFFVGKGQPADIIQKYNLGECALHQSGDIAQKLEKLLRMNINPKCPTEFKMENIAEKVAKILEELT